MKVLLTSTSFQDIPGEHKSILDQCGFDVTQVRGPLSADELKKNIASFDAVICGDDEFSAEIIRIGASGALKYISKYGVGLDRIDLEAAVRHGVKVANCPGVNQVSVAEHVLALLFSYVRNIPTCLEITKLGRWERPTGTEIAGKRIGIFGLGSVGREVARKAAALDMWVVVNDAELDCEFARDCGYEIAKSLDELIAQVDVLSLHVPLSRETRGIISYKRLKRAARKGLVIVNTARGGLVENEAIITALRDRLISGYLTDVLDEEPMPSGHPLKGVPGVYITPHIGSRTAESVQRQGKMAVENLIAMINDADTAKNTYDSMQDRS